MACRNSGVALIPSNLVITSDDLLRGNSHTSAFYPAPHNEPSIHLGTIAQITFLFEKNLLIPGFVIVYRICTECIVRTVIFILFILTVRFRRRSLTRLASFSQVLKVKPFKIFTAIHNSINLIGSEGRPFC